LVADAADPDFGRYIAVTITDRGGYKKAVGTYNITFAVSEKTSIIKRIRATITDDSPKAPVVNVTSPSTPAPATPAPNVVVNNPPAPAAQPTVINTPAPTPEVVVNVPPAPTEEAIAEPEPILAPPEVPEPWHLIDLLLAIAALVLGFVLIAFATRRRDDEDAPETNRGKQIRIWGQLGILLAVASTIVLLITQDFEGPMEMVDAWAILFAAIFGAELLAAIGIGGKKNDDWASGNA
jgi:hypothetical protein